MQTNRPTTTVRIAPVAPKPLWEAIFVEPVYAGGQSYDQPATDVEGEDDDLERPAA